MALKFNPTTGNLDLVLDKALEIKYDNSTSGLSSTNLQDSTDEIAALIQALPNPITYRGTWNAATNAPALSNSDTDVEGHLYQVNAAGTVDFGAGNISFEVGDKVVNNGSTWEKWDMTDAVTSVNSLTGDVILTTSNIAEGTNLYFTDERAQDAAGALATSSSKVSLTYNAVANTLTPDIVSGSLVNSDINASAAIELSKLQAVTGDRALISNSSGYITDSTVTATELSYLTGATSNLQAQINTKSGYYTQAINSDITLAAEVTYLVDTTAPRTLTLPPPALNAYVTIKDATGDSEEFAITIIPPATELIDGSSSYIISSEHESITLISDGTNWFTI